jgi:SAM-dependent methyltransferase
MSIQLHSKTDLVLLSHDSRHLQVLSKVPAEVLDKFYGCGAPLPAGIDGLTVLDLGSGSGRDCYAAAALVGEHGSVIGVDMTSEQLQVRQRARLATLEALP